MATKSHKSYKYLEWRKLKKDAESRASYLRRTRSKSVRVRKAAGGWGIYYKD